MLQFFNTYIHRHLHLHNIAVLPLSVNRIIAVGSGCCLNTFPVDGDNYLTIAHPARLTYEQWKFRAFLRCDGETRFAFIRKRSSLC